MNTIALLILSLLVCVNFVFAEESTDRTTEENTLKERDEGVLDITNQGVKSAGKAVAEDDQLPIINDNGPYSVNNEYVHVILRTPIEDWKDGPRTVTVLADMLYMQNFFTFSRLDRHQITFRVEENPEKKSAVDVARAINDSRFKNNVTRRAGLIVVRAGVGNKTNTD